MAKVERYQSGLEPQAPTEIPPRQEDRRIRGERLWVNFPVTLTHKGQPIMGYVEAVNMSWSGMFLATNFPLLENDRIILEFMLPNTELPITVRARVVRLVISEEFEDPIGIGVVFEDLEPNIRRMISGFVLENLPTD